MPVGCNRHMLKSCGISEMFSQWPLRGERDDHHFSVNACQKGECSRFRESIMLWGELSRLVMRGQSLSRVF